MFPQDKEALADKPRFFRYVFFVLSSFRLISPTQWREQGEPNPFVRETRRLRLTHKQEILDIFDESLGRH